MSLSKRVSSVKKIIILVDLVDQGYKVDWGYSKQENEDKYLRVIYYLYAKKHKISQSQVFCVQFYLMPEMRDSE